MIVAISTLITLIGLWCVLRKYFTTVTTLATLLLLALGTNFFLMSVYSGAIQASILLALMTLVMWMTQRWYEKPGWVEAGIAGLAMGCLILIKPAGFASILLFFFWGAYNKETFNEKWRIFREHSDQVLTILVLFLGGLFIRLFNPTVFEGTWFSDYVPHQRALYLLGPWLWPVLFSIKNGWLIYTPVVLFSLPGFNILANRNKKLFFATFLYCLAFLLLLASSPEVTAPDNFSQARMTEIFAVLFIPIGYFISWVLEGRWLRKTAFGLILVAVVGLNLFQTWQYRHRILDPWFTTTEYYSAVFLKTHSKSGDRQLMDYSQMDPASYLNNYDDFKVTTLAYYDFENDPGGFGGHVNETYHNSGKASFRLDSALQFTPTYSIPLGKLAGNYPLGIRASVNIYFPSITDTSKLGSLIISQRHNNILYHYSAFILKGRDYQAGKWYEIRLDYILPRPGDPGDELISYLWYPGKKCIYADDFKVELFEHKDQ